jgi:large subunit ribosomal protein L22
MVKKEQVKTAQAKARMIRISPRKLNLVAESIRGLKADKAVAQLTFSKKRVAEEAKKLLLSAIANAENNHNMDVDRLVVREAYVGKAMVMKRFQAGAKGRGNRILKPFSNMTIVVAENEIEAKATKAVKKTTKKEETK